MTDHSHSLFLLMGRIEGAIHSGIDGLHRRMDSQERSMRHLLKRNGGGYTRFLNKVTAGLLLLILGALSHLYPGAVKASVQGMIEKLLLAVIGG